MSTETIVAILSVLLGGGGVVALVKIAVGSESRRANDWREIAKTSAAAAEVNGGHVRELVGAVNQLATAQRECLAILQGIATDHRRTT
jgi:hypothetical protein